MQKLFVINMHLECSHVHTTYIICTIGIIYTLHWTHSVNSLEALPLRSFHSQTKLHKNLLTICLTHLCI